MKRAAQSRRAGYTIVETMIFLAVSAAMFTSAMALINGKQNRTEFTNSVRNFESSLNDIANDVSNGYYNNATSTGGSYKCSVNGNNITLGTGASTPDGCILIGKAIQFGPSGSNKEKYSTINLVGKQFINGSIANGDVKDINESSVFAVTPNQTTPNLPDASTDITIGGGVTVECVLYASSAVTPAASPCSNQGSMKKVDTISYMTTFHGLAAGVETSGSSQIDLLIKQSGNDVNVGRNKKDVAQELNGYNVGNVTNLSNAPGSAVYICLQSNGSNQYALVSLGGAASRTATQTSFYSGKCS